VEPHRVELRDGGASAPLAEGQVRARALRSGISQGTELLLYRGEGPTPFDTSLGASATSTYPRRYGYAWVGEIRETRSALHRLGQRIFALASHGDEHVLTAAQARPLPDSVPVERAVLAANLETAVNVVWDAGVGLGDRVLVIGGGIVGLLICHAARASGAGEVLLVESSAVRRRAAEKLGATVLAHSDAAQRESVDVAIEASGDPTNLDLAIASLRDEGVAVVASFYGARVAPVALGAEFHRRRLSLRSSQVSRVPPHRAPGWSFERRFALVTKLLENPLLDGLLEPAIPFREAAAVYARLAREPGATLQCIFEY
jgi:2-desacetyl-2-hydroxyethyl bacteriochlorophyllide A dehydrogenase